jgi:serine/threonine-protein kinase
MNPEQWKEIERLYHASVELPPENRSGFLAGCCDVEIRREVESLLAHRQQGLSFVERAAVDVAAEIVTPVPNRRTSLVGRTIGHYEVMSFIGSGGMGVVYRARDTRLSRDVAVKVLPEEFARQPDRLLRFDREAKLLASLSHPNIAGIYDLEESDTIRCLILEFVDGITLAERLKRGPLPVADALNVCGQIAEALEAAHEQGIVHRDLKPGNVMTTPTGMVKVLDFGIAKLIAEDASSSSPASVEPITISAVLGTPSYVSPEQIRGKPADKRSDIWALGCVLYETLAGKAAFEKTTVTETLVAIVEAEPDWSALPPGTPARVEDLLRRCLDKDPRWRMRDVGDVRIQIAEARHEPQRHGRALERPGDSRRTGWQRVTAASLGLLAMFLVAAAAARGFLWPTERVPRSMRFAIIPPQGLPLDIQGVDRDIAISPDGMRVIYRVGAGDASQLAVRAIDRIDSDILPNTAGARTPFVSPDGNWIGFFGPGRELKKISIAGGPAITVCRYSGFPRGASWGPDDTIVFATSDANTGLWRVSATGGEAKVLTTPDAAHGEVNHYFPAVLPGGRALLFTSTFGALAGGTAPSVAVLDLKTGQRKTLIRGGSRAAYVESGHLLYSAARSLRAVRFDAARLEVRGDPVAIAEPVMMSVGNDAANIDVSRDGTLLFATVGASGTAARRSLAWVNRAGREEPIKAPPRAYVQPRLSPDGSRVALYAQDQEHDIWIWDFTSETLRRLTLDPAVDESPVWTHDGRRIIFSSTRTGVANLFRQAADGSGTIERLTASPDPVLPTSIAPDGSRLILMVLSKTGGMGLGLLEMDGRRLGPLVPRVRSQRNPEISPDGHWLAYQSNESGQYRIYVRPFPDVDTGRWEVSSGGGIRPLWARNGHELFYLDSNNVLMTVPVQTTGATFSAGNPTRVFEAKYFVGDRDVGGRSYDVSPDGQRFLMIKDPAGTDQPSASTSANLVVVLNWSAELKQRLPIN